MAAAHMPGKEPELLFLLPLFGAFVCLMLLGFPTVGKQTRDEFGTTLFLAGVGIALAVLAGLMFLTAWQEFKADLLKDVVPAQAGEEGQP